MPDYKKIKCLSHLADQLKRILDGVEMLELRFLPGRVDMVVIYVKGNIVHLELPEVYSFEYRLPKEVMDQLAALYNSLKEAIKLEAAKP